MTRTALRMPALRALAKERRWLTSTGRISQTAMAADLGVSPPTVNRVLNGRQLPTEPFRRALLKCAVEVRPGALMTDYFELED